VTKDKTQRERAAKAPVDDPTASGARPLPVWLPDFEPPGTGFEDSHTQVHSVGELRAWIEGDESLTSSPSAAPPANDMELANDPWEPEATGIISPANLDKLVETSMSSPSIPIAHPERDSATVSGSLDEFNLIDLLQLFQAANRTGLLAVTNGKDTSRVFLQNGTPVCVLWNDDEAVSDEDALVHTGRMTSGQFFFGPTERLPPRSRPLTMMQVVLAMGPLDEPEASGPGELDFDDFTFGGQTNTDTSPFDEDSLPGTDRDTMPPPTPVDVRLQPTVPLEPPLRALRNEELDVFQYVLNYRSLKRVQQASKYGPERTARIVDDLIERGYIERKES
jgi:hypothetical protein